MNKGHQRVWHQEDYIAGTLLGGKCREGENARLPPRMHCAEQTVAIVSAYYEILYFFIDQQEGQQHKIRYIGGKYLDSMLELQRKLLTAPHVNLSFNS